MIEPITIVLADDHPLLREGLSFVLQRHPRYQIVGQASDGREALRLVRALKPTVVILDIQMPILDGFEVERTIRNENLDTKVIFLTMFKDAELIQKVIAIGVKGYVLKENAVTDIVECIESVCQDKFFISPQVSNLFLSNNRKSVADEGSALTAAEKKIIVFISEGKSSKEIADELFVSSKTVENHRSNICKKLGITGNSALLKYALLNKSALH